MIYESLIINTDNKFLNRIIVELKSSKLLKTINWHINDKKVKKELSIVVNANIINKKVAFECNNSIYYNIDKVISKYVFIPKIVDINPDFSQYKRDLIDLEFAKDRLKSRIFSRYNKTINNNFDILNGLDDLYNWHTGAVYFKDYEWEKIDNNNSLKKFFLKAINNIYLYSLPLDKGIILRGANVYYYFVSLVNRFKANTRRDIEKWINNVNIFINDSIDAIDHFKIKDNYDIRLLLGLVDNIRNIILMFLNCELIMLSNKKDFIYVDNFKNSSISEYLKLCQIYQIIIKDCVFQRPLRSHIVDNIKKMINLLNRQIQISAKKVFELNDDFIYDKGFNRLREIDNYFENFIVSEYIIKDIIHKKHLNEKDEINLLSILYGGLELPLIMQNNNFVNNKLNIGFIFQNNGNYFEKQNTRGNIKPNNKTLIFGNVNRDNLTFIIDDNIMSGVTMQLAYNLLIHNNINNIGGLIAIRHPDLNRIAQLKHYNCCFNLNLVNDFVYGLVTNTDFTKIKDNTNNDCRFVNELNIYSIQSEIFLKALYMNNSFIKDSDVDIFRGFSDGLL